MKQNNQIQTVIQLNLRYLCLNHPINNLNVKIDDIIYGNEIITYDVVVMDNFNSLSLVITAQLKTEIVVYIRKIIPK